MKPYGKSRYECAHSNIRGTSRPCPCCQPVNPADRRHRRMRKKTARQAAKKEISHP